MSLLQVPVIALAALIIGGLAFIRLAPHDPARWHVVPEPGARDFAAGVRRAVPENDDAFARLDRLIRATPRTRAIAGAPEAGHVTYVTRSRLFGFPDYTTVARIDGQIRILARLRFGTGDSGVNRARVEGWLADLARPAG